MFDGPHLRFRGVNEAVAQNFKKVTYNVTDQNTVTLDEAATDEPTIFSKVTATFNNTTTISGTIKNYQATKDNSLTFTLTGFDKKIKKIELNACKSSKGKGTADITIGGESFISNYDCTNNFYTGADNCQPLTLTPTDNTKDFSGDISITIKATVNSLYCNAYTIYYEDDDARTDANIQLENNALTIKEGSSAATSLQTDYDGTISVVTENSEIATAEYEHGIITVKGITCGSTNINIIGTGSETYKDIKESISISIISKQLSSSTEFTLSDYTGFAGTGYSTVTAEKSGITIKAEKGLKNGNDLQMNNSATNGKPGILYNTTPIKGLKSVSITFRSAKGYTITSGTEVTPSGNPKEYTTETEITYNVNDGDEYFQLQLTGGLHYISKVVITTTTELNIGATGYATFCTDQAYIMPEGLEGAIVSTEDNILTVDYKYPSNSVVPSNTGLLIKATSEEGKNKKYTFEISTEEGDDFSAINQLSGETDAEGMTVGAAGSKFYKLAAPEAGIGFYWGAPDGGAFKNGADKAYLVVPGTVNVQGFRFDGTTTGISGIAGATGTDAAIYTLDGRRVSGKADELPRGIYIVGGKKVIK